MAEPYQTPPSLVDAEQRLNETLGKLTKGLEGVEALSGIAKAFSDASHANKAAVAAFQEASSSFEKSSAAASVSLESLAQRVVGNQDEFSEALSEIREKLGSQNKKIILLGLLTSVPIVLIAILLFLSFSTWQ